jgi:hypothetical protein
MIENWAAECTWAYGWVHVSRYDDLPILLQQA